MASQRALKSDLTSAGSQAKGDLNRSAKRQTSASGKARRPTANAATSTTSSSKKAVKDKTIEASSKPLPDSPDFDRSLIEKMLIDRESLLEDLKSQGYSEASILRRAAELGLSDALLRQLRGVAADLAGERPGRRGLPSSLRARNCLSCERVFLSTGAGNRLCMRCRGGDAGLAQL